MSFPKLIFRDVKGCDERKVETQCQGASCPTVYEAENGDFLVQGYNLIQSELPEEEIPEGESIVRLPREFLKAFLESFSSD